MAAAEIPATYRALQFTSSTSPPSIVTLPTPTLSPGSVLVKPLRATLFPYTRDIFTRGNSRGYHYPLPLVPGSATIGRLVAAAPDVPSLSSSSGQLVWLDPVLRASDRSGVKILHGLNSGPSPAAKALASSDAWRNGSWGELVHVPAENVHLLDEDVLTNKLGYSLDDLGYLAQLTITYGGLRDVDVRPGETVLIAPATGSFGGAAVHVALALGANVIAMGRNQDILAELEGVAEKSYPLSRFTAVKLTGTSVDADKETIMGAAEEIGRKTDGMIDVYFDMSPPGASNSSHIKAGIMALRPGGRMSLMGGAAGDVGFPYYQIMVKGLRLQGSWMYTPQQVEELIRLVEDGRLKLGEQGAGVKCLGVFGLEAWEEAFRVAGDGGRVGRFALLAPSGKEAA
ncbi:alcohol dehydrogenase [Apodospora peruviana]|uniref:Alcohol dehydrogenase n=1 Tax=Apodospora peruviana TaxID=516989 RepID=A0AAE0HVX2_9PEZI|nr:alcohol dehydrogenase [Apodospora peruviana]